MKNTTPKTKTKTTKPVVDIVKILAGSQELIDEHEEALNAHADAINSHAKDLSEISTTLFNQREDANVLDAKVTLVFWFCGITTAIATALAITALVCK
jgi:hypothetical protein